jgi:hypothetical protein
MVRLLHDISVCYPRAMTKRIMFVLAAALLFIGGLYVRSLNGSSSRKQAADIVRLDSSGADISPTLDSLKTYVHTHMGASATVVLNGSFGRADAAAKVAAQAPTASAQVYADAQKACSGHTDSITQARCNTQYIQAHLANLPSPTPVPQPKVADYTYRFVSPLWTPDLAGALILGAVAALIIGLARLPRRRRE